MHVTIADRDVFIRSSSRDRRCPACSCNKPHICTSHTRIGTRVFFTRRRTRVDAQKPAGTAVFSSQNSTPDSNRPPHPMPTATPPLANFCRAPFQNRALIVLWVQVPARTSSVSRVLPKRPASVIAYVPIFFLRQILARLKSSIQILWG